MDVVVVVRCVDKMEAWADHILDVFSARKGEAMERAQRVAEDYARREGHTMEGGWIKVEDGYDGLNYWYQDAFRRGEDAFYYVVTQHDTR